MYKQYCQELLDGVWELWRDIFKAWGIGAWLSTMLSRDLWRLGASGGKGWEGTRGCQAEDGTGAFHWMTTCEDLDPEESCRSDIVSKKISMLRHIIPLIQLLQKRSNMSLAVLQLQRIQFDFWFLNLCCMCCRRCIASNRLRTIEPSTQRSRSLEKTKDWLISVQLLWSISQLSAKICKDIYFKLQIISISLSLRRI